MAIDKVNRRQAHLESVLKAGGRIAGPKVECGELNTKPMAMALNKMPSWYSYLSMHYEGLLFFSRGRFI